MTRDYDAEIKKLEEDFQSKIEILEGIYQEYIVASTDFFANWYMNTAESIVKGEPEITKGLGKEYLTAMKQKVRELQDKTDDIVSSEMDKNKNWYHKDTLSVQPNYFSDSPSIEEEQTLRRIAGQLGPILEEYGYIEVNYAKRLGWRERNRDGSINSDNPNPIYPYTISWGDDQKELMRKYHDLMEKAKSTKSTTDRLKSEKEKSEAKDLWDDA